MPAPDEAQRILDNTPFLIDRIGKGEGQLQISDDDFRKMKAEEKIRSDEAKLEEARRREAFEARKRQEGLVKAKFRLDVAAHAAGNMSDNMNLEAASIAQRALQIADELINQIGMFPEDLR